MTTWRPAEFDALDRFAAKWGLPTLMARRVKRLNSTLSELREFYDTVLPHLERIVEFLNQFPLDSIPAEHVPLANMALAMIEIDDPLNKWDSVHLDEAIDPRFFTVKQSFYDTGHERRFAGNGRD